MATFRPFYPHFGRGRWFAIDEHRQREGADHVVKMDIDRTLGFDRSPDVGWTNVTVTGELNDVNVRRHESEASPGTTVENHAGGGGGGGQ